MGLTRLKNVVSKDLGVITRLNLPVDEILVEDFSRALLEETQRIKDHISQTVVGMLRENELRRYVRTCQYDLVKLGGRLLRYTEVNRLVATEDQQQFTPLDWVCHYVFQSITELLTFIERHFGKYVLWSAWVPSSYLTITRHRVSLKLADLKARLDEADINAELRQFICRPLDKFLSPDEPVTYGGVRYLLNFQDEFLNMLTCHAERSRSIEGKPVLTASQPALSGVEGKLHELLFILNYNTRSYFLYHVETIGRTLAQKATVLEKLHMLSTESKRFSLMPQNRSRYNRAELNLTDMIRSYIREVIAGLELEYRMEEMIQKLDTGATDKVPLPVSVASLAAGVHSIMGSEKFPEEVITAIGRHLSAGFTTPRSGGSFSVGTFRKYYYDISDHSKQTMIGIFQKAITWLKKN